MAKVIADRMTAQVKGDFVVFLIFLEAAFGLAHQSSDVTCWESLNIGAPVLLRRCIVQSLVDEHASENQEHQA